MGLLYMDKMYMLVVTQVLLSTRVIIPALFHRPSMSTVILDTDTPCPAMDIVLTALPVMATTLSITAIQAMATALTALLPMVTVLLPAIITPLQAMDIVFVMDMVLTVLPAMVIFIKL